MILYLSRKIICNIIQTNQNNIKAKIIINIFDKFFFSFGFISLFKKNINIADTKTNIKNTIVSDVDIYYIPFPINLINCVIYSFEIIGQLNPHLFRYLIVKSEFNFISLL